MFWINNQKILQPNIFNRIIILVKQVKIWSQPDKVNEENGNLFAQYDTNYDQSSEKPHHRLIKNLKMQGSEDQFV